MTWTRRRWIAAALAAAAGVLFGRRPVRADAEGRKPRPRPRAEPERKTRWIGHY